MPVPSFGKLLATSALASGAIFTALTAPLVIFSAEPAVIQVNGENIFDGKLQEIAAPYLGLAGLVSLSVGVAGVSVSGWRRATQRNEEVEQQLSSLRQSLTEKESQIQGMLLSEKNLDTSGLRFFLEDETLQQVSHAEPLGISVPQATPVRPEPVVVKAPVYPIPTVAQRRRSLPPQVTVQSAVSPLHAAQAFLSFTRSHPSDAYTDTALNRSAMAQGQVAFEQIQDLQSQLKQIMSQIESLQTNLAFESPVSSKVANSYVTATLPHLDQRVQALESQWVMRQAAS
jgi:hypothetical protein